MFKMLSLAGAALALAASLIAQPAVAQENRYETDEHGMLWVTTWDGSRKKACEVYRTPCAPNHLQLAHQGLLVGVEQIERGWTSPNRFQKPAAGNEYLTMQVAVVNHRPETIKMNGFDFELEDADGYRLRGAFVRAPYMAVTDVLPGTTYRAWLTFEVPQGKAIPTLYWKAAYGVLLPVTVNL
jgi:Domain of unknown function (DUF4352)